MDDEAGGRVLGEEGAEQEKWQLPHWVAPLPGHTHKQLLVTIPSHTQTECRLQLHKSSTWSQEDAFRRCGWEGDLLTPNLEGGAKEGDRQIRESGRPPTHSYVNPGEPP